MLNGEHASPMSVVRQLQVLTAKLEQTRSLRSSKLASLSRMQGDLVAGAVASIISLPISIASGVLAFAPLGSKYAAVGAAAGLSGAIVTRALSALVATSSFVITSPGISLALLLSSLAGTLTVGSSGYIDEHLFFLAI